MQVATPWPTPCPDFLFTQDPFFPWIPVQLPNAQQPAKDERLQAGAGFGGAALAEDPSSQPVTKAPHAEGLAALDMLRELLSSGNWEMTEAARGGIETLLLVCTEQPSAGGQSMLPIAQEVLSALPHPAVLWAVAELVPPGSSHARCCAAAAALLLPQLRQLEDPPSRDLAAAAQHLGKQHSSNTNACAGAGCAAALPSPHGHSPSNITHPCTQLHHHICTYFVHTVPPPPAGAASVDAHALVLACFHPLLSMHSALGKHQAELLAQAAKEWLPGEARAELLRAACTAGSEAGRAGMHWNEHTVGVTQQVLNAKPQLTQVSWLRMAPAVWDTLYSVLVCVCVRARVRVAIAFGDVCV
jgi:hypothetical protein